MMPLIAALALASVPAVQSSPDPRHLIGAVTWFSVSSKTEGELPAPRNPTLFGVSAYYGYRTLGPLHLGISADMNSYTTSVGVLCDVYGRLGDLFAVGGGITLGPTWYWREELSGIRSPGGRVDAHVQIVSQLTTSLAVGFRASFMTDTFDRSGDAGNPEYKTHYIWAFPVGVVANYQL